MNGPRGVRIPDGRPARYGRGRGLMFTASVDMKRRNRSVEGLQNKGSSNEEFLKEENKKRKS